VPKYKILLTRICDFDKLHIVDQEVYPELEESDTIVVGVLQVHTEEYALDAFHIHYPIKVLDNFEITCKPLKET